MSRGIARQLFIEEINKIFKKAYKKVKRIRKIIDDKQRTDESFSAKSKLRNEWDVEALFAYNQHKKSGELGFWQDVEQGFTDITQEKYEGLNSPYQLLLNIWTEADAKVKKFEENENPSQFPKIPQQNTNQPAKQETILEQSQEDNYTCFECLKKKNGDYFYNAKTNEREKLCSEKCYLEYWGKICNVCKNKFLKFHRDDNQFIYCSSCWKSYHNKKIAKLLKEQEEDQKEKAKIKKLIAENKEIMRKNNEIINSLGNDYNEKVNENTEESDKNLNNNNETGNMIERERERERANLEVQKTNNHLIYWELIIGGLGLITLVSFLIFKRRK